MSVQWKLLLKFVLSSDIAFDTQFCPITTAMIYLNTLYYLEQTSWFSYHLLMNSIILSILFFYLSIHF